MAAPVQIDPAEDKAGFERHVYADLHDIAQRLDNLEKILMRFTDLLDICEPQIKAYARMSVMRGIGRGRRSGGG